jgi:hypothetical protein
MLTSQRCRRLGLIAAAALLPALHADAQSAADASAVAQQAAQHDGAHDFDFIIGDWKSHVRRLPDRLVGSNKWIEYDGTSKHRKLLDSNANFEEFEAQNTAAGLHLKAQTLRLYNPESHQWSLYLIDVDKGTLELPPLIGQFNGRKGEFYEYTDWKGRTILVRFQWTNISPKSAHFEQAFSADGGKTWEVNWINDLSR